MSRSGVPRAGMAATAVALLLAGCGGSTDEAAQKLASRSVVDVAPPLRKTLVSQREIDASPPGSPRRDFLQYWSLLQYQAWPEATSLFEPGLLRTIGVVHLVQVFTAEGAYFRSVKPRVVGVDRHGNRATVRYVVQDLSGKETPRSISWQRSSGHWRIVYDPFLDAPLRDAVQHATQISIDPTPPTVADEAVKAGEDAATRQASYLRSLQRPGER
jgi:hypothetical protein